MPRKPRPREGATKIFTLNKSARLNDRSSSRCLSRTNSTHTISSIMRGGSIMPNTDRSIPIKVGMGCSLRYLSFYLLFWPTTFFETGNGRSLLPPLFELRSHVVHAGTPRTLPRSSRAPIAGTVGNCAATRRATYVPSNWRGQSNCGNA